MYVRSIRDFETTGMDGKVGVKVSRGGGELWEFRQEPPEIFLAAKYLKNSCTLPRFVGQLRGKCSDFYAGICIFVTYTRK